MPVRCKSASVDIYAFALCVLEMLTGIVSPLTPGEIRRLANQGANEGTMPEAMSQLPAESPFKAFLEMCFRPTATRPTAQVGRACLPAPLTVLSAPSNDAYTQTQK